MCQRCCARTRGRFCEHVDARFLSGMSVGDMASASLPRAGEKAQTPRVRPLVHPRAAG